MPKVIKPLTVMEIEHSKPKEKEYFLYDGDNLRLLIKPNGSKIWIYRFMWEGKTKKIYMGSFLKSRNQKNQDEVGCTLEEARRIKQGFKKSLENGEMPLSAKNEIKQKEELRKQASKVSEERRFGKIVEDFFNFIDISPSHHKRQVRRMERKILPSFGKRSIDNITRKELIECILQIETVEEKHRILTLCGQIWRWAVSNDRANKNIVLEIDRLHTLPRKVRAKNYRTLTDPDTIKELLKAIDEYKGDISTKTALQLAPYVALRPFNLRCVEWDEIDFEKKIITISGAKMKTRRDHIVPLTDTTISIIMRMRPFSFGVSKFVFPSPITNLKPISDNTMNFGLKRIGFADEIVVHGFRAMFSTLVNEHRDQDIGHGVSRDIIEVQLAHKVETEVSGAYNRAIYLKQRQHLMQWWSDYLDGLKK